MKLNRIAAVALAVLGLASTGDAQTGVDVSRLPVDLQRIHRELRQSTVRDESKGLLIRYKVDVYGVAPPIELFNRTDPDLFNGPVPYGAPTHREMIENVTPREYRAPAADFSALLRWFAEKTAQRQVAR
jgi:hypothetical protein